MEIYGGKNKEKYVAENLMVNPKYFNKFTQFDLNIFMMCNKAEENMRKGDEII